MGEKLIIHRFEGKPVLVGCPYDPSVRGADQDAVRSVLAAVPDGATIERLELPQAAERVKRLPNGVRLVEQLDVRRGLVGFAHVAYTEATSNG